MLLPPIRPGCRFQCFLSGISVSSILAIQARIDLSHAHFRPAADEQAGGAPADNRGPPPPPKQSTWRPATLQK